MWALCSNGGYFHSFDIYMSIKENEAIDIVPNIGLGQWFLTWALPPPRGRF